jgi:hypothetical protein
VEHNSNGKGNQGAKDVVARERNQGAKDVRARKAKSVSTVKHRVRVRAKDESKG